MVRRDLFSFRRLPSAVCCFLSIVLFWPFVSPSGNVTQQNEKKWGKERFSHEIYECMKIVEEKRQTKIRTIQYHLSMQKYVRIRAKLKPNIDDPFWRWTNSFLNLGCPVAYVRICLGKDRLDLSTQPSLDRGKTMQDPTVPSSKTVRSTRILFCPSLKTAKRREYKKKASPSFFSWEEAIITMRAAGLYFRVSPTQSLTSGGQD